MKLTWADNNSNAALGEIVAIIERTDFNQQGTCSLFTSGRLARKNMSGEPILRGWAGTTNNISLYAVGCGVVVRFARDGDRCQVHALPDTDPRVMALCIEEGIE